MSSIDINKLKANLEKYGIFILEYYTIDNKCAMLKGFVTQINQFLLIYIPSKIRSEIKNKNNTYELKTLDEVVDEEDYAKFDEFQISMINDKKNKDVYKNEVHKYTKNIVINGDGIEQFEKRIMRQVKRLNIPFSKLEYTLGIQNKKIVALNFGDEINLFYIKNYTKDVRCYLYILNIKELIDNITEIQYELGNINNQFLNIVYEIVENNIKEISGLQEVKYEYIIDQFKQNITQYKQKESTFNSLIKIIDSEEKKEIKKYRELFIKESSVIRKNTLENEYQTILKNIYKKKSDRLEEFIDETYIFNIFFLLLEEISFDNSVMLKRINMNFEKLKAIFK